MLWNGNLFPPGGFVFVDADAIEHTGGSITDLASKIAEYRVRRGQPPGNPASEVNDQLCAKFPSRCLKGEPPSAEVLEQSRQNVAISSIGQWLRETWQRVASKRQKYAPEEVIEARVSACLGCKFRQAFKSDCPACQESLNTVSFQLRAGRDKLSKVLPSCGRFHTDLRVDVLLEQPPRPEAPENCWKRS
jgi:hypothetical protein